MKIKKSSKEASDIDDDLITVYNFFVHLIKEISIRKYGSNKELIPTFSPNEAWKTLLYSKEAVYFNQTAINRRIHDGSGFTATALDATQIATAQKTKTKKPERFKYRRTNNKV